MLTNEELWDQTLARIERLRREVKDEKAQRSALDFLQGALLALLDVPAGGLKALEAEARKRRVPMYKVIDEQFDD